MLNAQRYVGLPFRAHGRDRSGVDCWGLVRLAYGETWGIELPSLAEGYQDIRDRGGIRACVDGETPQWQPVSGRGRAGDVALLRLRGVPLHVGLLLDGRRFLHADHGAGSVVLERLDGAVWRDRLLGLYRHPEVPA